MDELKNFNARKLYQKLTVSDEEFSDWLKELGLLRKTRNCDECGGNMSLKQRPGENYPTWRCTTMDCRKEKGYLTGTWFEGAHLTLKEVFQLSYFWCRQTHTQDEIQFDMQRDDGSTIAPRIVVDWKNFYREVCSSYFVLNPVKIGGPGVVVEIDETVISKRKYNRGRLIVNQQWFFGGVERGSGRCFLVPVERRDAATLLPIIQEFIMPGTSIMSDCWRAYGGIANLPEQYAHLTVNHSVNFVDPDTGAHTQSVEATWASFKSRHKEEHGTSRELFGSYIAQFMWRRQFKGEDVMFHLWEQIRAQYPI